MQDNETQATVQENKQPIVENQPETEVNNATVNTAPKKAKPTLILGIVAVVVIVAAVLGISLTSGPNFKKIYNKHCESTWAELGSDGSFLSIDTNPYDFEDDGIAYTAAYNAVKTVNKELKLPDSLFEDMGATSGADGKQEQQFKNVTVSWKYHPDSGLEVIYRKN